jgi:outer membrane protein TolC
MELNKHNPLARFGRALTVAAALACAAMAHGQVSLKTVVDLAQRNSQAVKMAQADVAKAQAVYEQTRDAYIPSLNFSTGIPAFPSSGFTGQPPSIYTMTVESLVFSIPQKRYMDAARSGWRAAESRLKDAREQVALDASNAYIELDTVNAELAAGKRQEEFANRLVEIEQQRAEAGVDPLHALLEAKLTVANMKLARLHLETRAGILSKQLATLTGLPSGSISPDHASIPEVPQISGDLKPNTIYSIEAARLTAHAREQQATGDRQTNFIPVLGFGAQYNRNTTILNDVNSFFAKPLPANNFSSGFNVQVPLFDMIHRAKGRESAADALRATAEAEQAERQNDVVIAELSGTLRELNAQAEVTSLKQQIAADDLKTVQTQMQTGNGAGVGPGAPAQLSPTQEQLAMIDERQKYQDAQESALNLAKARLNLLRALGHMQDWLNEVHTK